MICGAYNAMAANARSWFCGLEPAHPSATTRTDAPASAAGKAVESTQQSVDTPASVIVG